MEQESKQEGAVEEQPKEQVSAEVSKPTSPEAKATSRIEDTVEYRNIQSQKDKADARAIKAEKAVESMQNQLQEFRNEMERQRLEDQKKQLDALSDDPDAQRKLMAKFDLDKERREFESRMKQEREGLNRAVTQIGELAETYNLTAKDIREILDAARSPKEMELMAQLKAAERKEVTSEKTTEPAKEKEGETFTTDSGKSDAGADDDASFQERWNAGDLPATKENMARAQKIISK